MPLELCGALVLFCKYIYCQSVNCSSACRHALTLVLLAVKRQRGTLMRAWSKPKLFIGCRVRYVSSMHQATRSSLILGLD